MKKLFLIASIILVTLSMRLSAQEMMALLKPDDSKKPVSSSSNLPVYEFRTSPIESQLSEIDSEEITNHVLGETVAKKFYLFERKYTYEVPSVPGNPQSKTMVRKPIVYDAVLRVEKHLKKMVKKGETTNDEASFSMNKVLDTALSILTVDTDGFEKAISKASNNESLTNLFLHQVKLVM